MSPWIFKTEFHRDTSEELGLWSKNVTRYLLNKICDIEKKRKKKNSIGPSTVPCGTPESIVASSEYSPSSATRIFLSVGKDVSHVWSGPLIPYWSILWRSLSWDTVSKALEKSRIRMSTCFPLSNDCSMSCMVKFYKLRFAGVTQPEPMV